MVERENIVKNNYKPCFRGFLVFLLLIALVSPIVSQSSEYNGGNIKWPQNGKAKITDVFSKNGKQIEFKYDLIIQMLDKDFRKVSFQNYEILPTKRKELSKIEIDTINKKLNVRMETPDLLIDLNANIVEILEFDKYLITSKNKYLNKRKLTSERIRRINELYASSKIKDAMEITFSKRWGHWRVDLSENSILKGVPYKTPILRKTLDFTLDFDSTITILDGKKEGTYEINKKIDLGRDDLINSMESFSKKSPLFKKGKDVKDYIKKHQQRVETKLIVSSDTMQLLYAEIKSESSIKLIGKKVKNTDETNEYYFNWD